MARIKVADLKSLLQQWNREEISFSFMVEKLNEIAAAKEGWRSEPVECDICTKLKTNNTMKEFTQLKTDFLNAQEAFKNGLENLTNQFQEHQEKKTGKVSLDNGFIDNQPSDFGLHYCLTETMVQLERCIKEKPSRELALVKTKLQEARFWATQV